MNVLDVATPVGEPISDRPDEVATADTPAGKPTAVKVYGGAPEDALMLVGRNAGAPTTSTGHKPEMASGDGLGGGGDDAMGAGGDGDGLGGGGDATTGGGGDELGGGGGGDAATGVGGDGDGLGGGGGDATTTLIGHAGSEAVALAASVTENTACGVAGAYANESANTAACAASPLLLPGSSWRLVFSTCPGNAKRLPDNESAKT